MSLQCALALFNTSSMLGCISKKTASRLKDIFPFLPLLRLHMSTVPSSRLPTARRALTYWNMFRVEFGGPSGLMRTYEEVLLELWWFVFWGFVRFLLGEDKGNILLSFCTKGRI